MTVAHPNMWHVMCSGVGVGYVASHLCDCGMSCVLVWVWGMWPVICVTGMSCVLVWVLGMWPVICVTVAHPNMHIVFALYTICVSYVFYVGDLFSMDMAFIPSAVMSNSLISVLELQYALWQGALL